MKTACTLKRKMTKLFESTKKLTALATGETDAKTIFTTAPYLQWQKLKVVHLYRQYLETL